MKVVKLIIAYDGTDFFGWQRQNKKRSVQREIERVLTRLMKHPVQIDGAGRTDAGVHAYGQVATFKAAVPMAAENLKRVMNNFLPKDIAIMSAEFVAEDFHARYSATGKTYEYHVLNQREPDVFNGRTAYIYPYDLDDALIQAACKRLIGSHNFESFKASGSSAQNPHRTIHQITYERSGNALKFTFTGDGFLYKMIRILVAFLLEVGNHRVPLEVLDEILKKPSRQYTAKVAPAQGLFLKEVYY